jgi:hypothetical protein
MPKLVNSLSHGVRVRDDDGRLVRLRPGQVGTFEGSTADKLSAIEGVNPAKKTDEDAWKAQVDAARGNVEGRSGFDNILSQARTAVGMQSIVAPLNHVVGDDAAPYGPNTGTITTKQALSQDPEARKHFADHERVPGEQDNENLNEVERRQAELTTLAQEVTEQMQDNGALGGGEPEGESQSEPEPQPAAQGT